ncbi:uncharacterized protein LOC135395701 [Ornithodoros turicata]|uniref:uncharacterized protein LOC135395701 n=1 Tax=Ornithodoros turicata TaxID=34597 RepID=UPI003139E880
MTAFLAFALEFLDPESEDETENSVAAAAAELITRRERTRVPLYYENVVPRYMIFEYKRMFRLSPNLVKRVAFMYQESEFHPQPHGGRPCIPAEKAILITLSYLAFDDPIAKIADKFDVTESTGHKTVTRVLKFLQRISSDVIAWPSGERRSSIEKGFLTKVKGAGIPDVIGCVDGSHIEINRPRESRDSYFNRKKYHSIVLQGICDHQMKFLDVFVGFPGSAHDARILRSSFFFFRTPKRSVQFLGGYILGDSAYPLLPWLLTPYRDIGQGLSAWKRKYNLVHSQQRVTIEHAFGVLKQRFQRLYYVDTDSIHQACLIVLGPCVLHNMCAEQDDIDDIHELPDVEWVTTEEEEQIDESGNRHVEETRRDIALGL